MRWARSRVSVRRSIPLGVMPKTASASAQGKKVAGKLRRARKVDTICKKEGLKVKSIPYIKMACVCARSQAPER